MKLIVILFSSFFALGLGSHADAATFASEYDLLRQLPTNTLAALTGGGEPDAQGLVGSHKRDGKWYESGRQRGGCWYLIGAVVAGDEKRADAAWKSIETTFAHQLDDGGFLSNPNPSRNHLQSFDERVETAFFYLQELGHAILVVRASPLEGHFHDRVGALEPRIRRACVFVQSGYDGIIKRSSKAANRIFIAAKAFGLCGKVVGSAEFTATSRRLVGVALELRDANGVFIENGGRDSSYNAVSLLMAQVLAFYQPDPKLDAALDRAMKWQRTRILPTGEVLVAGNSRTGLGQEKSIEGGIKKVNYNEVALALCYFGKTHDDPGAVVLAEKVRTWQDRSAK